MIKLNEIYNIDCFEGHKLIDDKSIDLIYTDLPYGKQTKNKWDQPIDLEKLWIDYKRILKPKGNIVLHSQGMFTAKLMLSNEKWWKYNLVWNKKLVSGFLNANKRQLRSHEDILVFFEKLGTYNPIFEEGAPLHSKGSKYKIKDGTNHNYGYYDSTKEDTRAGSTQKYPKSILEFMRPKPPIHPTQKPIELAEYIVKTYSNENDIILDSTCGSGTIPVACVNTKRNWIAFETDGISYPDKKLIAFEVDAYRNKIGRTWEIIFNNHTSESVYYLKRAKRRLKKKIEILTEQQIKIS